MPYYEQPGRTTTTDANGKQILTVTFVGDQEASPPDDVRGTQKSKSVVKDVAGQIRTTYTFEVDDPTNPSRPISGVTVEYVASVRTVPIEAHPNFKEPYLTPEDLKKIKDAVQVPDRSPDFEDTSDKKRAISLYGYLIAGVTSYYEPALIVRKSYVAASPPPSKIIGKILDPGVPVPGRTPKTNFLLISINARGQPGNYQVTEEYEMSGPSGWDSYLYG
ncbi:hypothetical protein EBZ39_11600 [bacterium]|nr:hypothetical protein [bacterium]